MLSKGSLFGFVFLFLAQAPSALALDSSPHERRVLFISDSHGVGPFGEEMDETLRKIPHATVDTYAIGASQPDSFLTGFTTTCGFIGHCDNHTPPAPRGCNTLAAPILKDILHGQAVVVAEGTNQIADSRGWEFAQNAVEELVTIIQHQGSRCVWVGPPKMRQYSTEDLAHLYTMLGTALRGDTHFPPCTLIDSRPFTEYPANDGDGVHYSWNPTMDKLGHAWGAAVSRLVADALVD